jgi:hypothetical protein
VSNSVSLLRAPPAPPPPPQPLPRQEWSTAGCFRRTPPTRLDDPNRQARSSLPQRTPARSTRRPPQWHRHEARGRCSYDGCYRKSVPGTTKHTGCSRIHSHEHQSQAWRKALGTVLERKGGPVGATASAAQHEEGRVGMAARHRSGTPRSRSRPRCSVLFPLTWPKRPNRRAHSAAPAPLCGLRAPPPSSSSGRAPATFAVCAHQRFSSSPYRRAQSRRVIVQGARWAGFTAPGCALCGRKSPPRRALGWHRRAPKARPQGAPPRRAWSSTGCTLG